MLLSGLENPELERVEVDGECVYPVAKEDARPLSETIRVGDELQWNGEAESRPVIAVNDYEIAVDLLTGIGTYLRTSLDNDTVKRIRRAADRTLTEILGPGKRLKRRGHEPYNPNEFEISNV